MEEKNKKRKLDEIEVGVEEVEVKRVVKEKVFLIFPVELWIHQLVPFFSLQEKLNLKLVCKDFRNLIQTSGNIKIRVNFEDLEKYSEGYQKLGWKVPPIQQLYFSIRRYCFTQNHLSKLPTNLQSLDLENFG